MPDPFGTFDPYPPARVAPSVAGGLPQPPRSTGSASVRGASHIVSAPQELRTQELPESPCPMPCPPASGDYVLTCQNGVMTWEEIGTCP